MTYSVSTATPGRFRHRKFALLVGLVIGVQILLQRLPSVTAAPACHFTLGFAQLRAQLGPSAVGVCVADEVFDAGAGEAVQPTVKGLMAWRKMDGGTAFSDGHRTWVAGAYGLQQRLNTERFCWEVGAHAGRCLRSTDGQLAAGGDALERELGALMAAVAATFQKRAGELHGELGGAWEGVTLSVARTLATR